MTRAAYRWAALACIAAARAASAQPPSVDSLAALVPRSPFVFVATVVAPSVPVVPRGPVLRHIASLRVLESIGTPPGFRVRRGDPIRLVLYAADSPPVGSRAIVFASGWLADDTLSLQQVARFAVRSETDWRSVKASYDSLRLASREAALQGTMAQSSLVAVATVISVVRLPDTRPPIARGEHDPVWQRVTITALRVMKGDSTLVGRPVSVLVPTNHGDVWGQVPRLVRGQTALFLLSSIPSTSLLPAVDSTTRLTLADSIAVRPPADTMLLRSPR